jgi:hypothetical protein
MMDHKEALLSLSVVAKRHQNQAYNNMQTPIIVTPKDIEELSGVLAFNVLPQSNTWVIEWMEGEGVQVETVKKLDVEEDTNSEAAQGELPIEPMDEEASTLGEEE